MIVHRHKTKPFATILLVHGGRFCKTALLSEPKKSRNLHPINKIHKTMGKKEKPAFLDYLNAVKKADREREIELHGKQISTRPQRIVRSKKVYDRNRKKRDCSGYDDGLFFCWYAPRPLFNNKKGLNFRPDLIQK